MSKTWLIRIAILSAVTAAGLALWNRKPWKHYAPIVGDAACAQTKADVEILTVNAGLAPGAVDLSGPRTRPFIDAMRPYRNVGIACFQEVWIERDAEAVMSSFAPGTHIYRHDTRGKNEASGRDVCTHAGIDSLVACMRAECGDEPDERAAICATKRCRLPLGIMRATDLPCLNCLVATVGEPIDDVTRICTSPDGRSRWYGGSNGVILASKWPLRNRRAVELPSSGANRLVLFATVDIPGIGRAEVGCTHLSSRQAIPPTDLRFSDWEDEEIEQIRIAVDEFRRRDPSGLWFFIGDMNTGPQLSRRSVAESPRAWQALTDAGFRSHAAESRAYDCTSCEENTLRKGAKSKIIDHVLVRAPRTKAAPVPVCGHRILMETRTVRGYDDRPVETHPSDHFGVIMKFDVE